MFALGPSPPGARGLGALFLLLTACSASGPAPGDPIPVAVSVPPQAYFVERIGGDRVKVAVMIPPGYSHVDYPLTPRSVTALHRAALYVKVGHPGFEFERRFVDPFLAENPGIRVVDMSRGMRLLAGEGEGARNGGHDHAGATGDPHVWVAPATVRVAAVNIADGLAEADPAHADEYRANLRDFLADVDRLDREIRALLAGREGGRFMVYHPDWGYFARQYGLEQIAIESEGKEPSARRLVQLIEEARREEVKVIFVQGGFPRKSAQVIAEAVGGEVVTADPQQKDWLANLRRVAAELSEALAHV